MKKITLEWFAAAGVRAIKTAAQTAASLFTVGMVMSDINWKVVVSAALVAGLYSIVTSLAGLPEVGSDGTLQIDTTSSEDKDIYRLDLGDEVAKLSTKKSITLAVNAKADLSQK